MTDVAHDTAVDAGDMFDVLGQSECEDRLRLNTAKGATPGTIAPLIFVSTELALDESDLGVVTVATVEEGFAEVLIKRPGTKPFRATIVSDSDVLLGDRLLDFVEFDHDPETGETFYGAWAEY